MKKQFILVMSLTCAGLLCCCTESGRRQSTSESYPKARRVTRFVQYNVGAFSKEIENSIPMVAAMMKEIGADAVSLNELDSCNARHANNQLEDLAGEMGGWNHRFSRAMPYLGGAYGVGVAVPGEIMDSFTIPLPRGEGTEPRACCVVETREYVFASTHLDYKDKPSMVIQARTINEAITKRYSHTGKPVILAGDMNSVPDSDVLSELGKEWDVLSCRKDTYSAIDPHTCIDFILALRNGAKYKVKGSDVPMEFREGDVKVASDHLPVFVDVRLRHGKKQ
ncbi:MAG: endonuclease/exonuclease/phosphatase family protein [Bacteroidales bacterium]|nr:endonuclease/exonuclease/phosphatase family protein [Bacteroidales bacterium]